MAGVLIVAGATGMRFASAGVTGTATDIVVVDGEEFDVAGCDDLQINEGSVICDGEVLAPVDDLGAAEAAELGAAALEASCDVFAAGLDVAQNEAEANEADATSGATRSDAGRDVEDDELVEDDAIADQQADVAEAQQNLLLACLALAEAKDGLDAAEEGAEDAPDEADEDAAEDQDAMARPTRSAGRVTTRTGTN
jgi:colicin import membrane protein